MIGVSVTEDDGLDIRKVYLHHVNIVQQAFSANSGIEQESALLFALFHIHEHRKTVLGQRLRVIEGIGAQRVALRDLIARHQDVDHVIHDDRNPDLVNLLQVDYLLIHFSLHVDAGLERPAKQKPPRRRV